MDNSLVQIMSQISVGRNGVLILVVMDNSLVLADATNQTTNIRCLNPCCNGQ